MLASQGTGDALLGNKRQTSQQQSRQSNIISDQIGPSQNVSSSPKKPRQKKQKAQAQFTYILKIFNIILGFIMSGFGFYCYYGFNTDAKSGNNFYLIGYILPGYIALSGLIILAIEMHIKFITNNMKFLYNYFGRGFFNLYVGVMPLCLLDTSATSQQETYFQVIIYVMTSLVLFIGILYILAKVCCCAKQGEKRKKKRQQQQSSSSEDSDQ